MPLPLPDETGYGTPVPLPAGTIGVLPGGALPGGAGPVVVGLTSELPGVEGSGTGTPVPEPAGITADEFPGIG